jgi:PhnB protein
MTQVNPYLHFNGTCREAMTFYRECLGGELKLMAVGDSPMAARMPAETHGRILHALLTNGGITLMASDMMGPEPLNRGNGTSLSLVCSSREEVERFFAALSAGGKVLHPLADEFFGTHGNLVDRYGVSWMFTFEAPRR